MGIIDTIKEKLHLEGNEGQTMKMISQLITESGGLSGLVGKFNAAGFGDKIQSWISPGTKLPITADQIGKALGATQLQSLGTKFGLDSKQVAEKLADQMPDLLGKLSPENNVSNMDNIKNKINDLKH